MKTAWVMKEGERRLVVDLIPKTTTIGVTTLQGYADLIPTIMLSYSLPYLEKVLPVLQEMKALGLVPKVHIWNRTKRRPGPELRVDFRVPCAGRSLIERFIPEDMLNTLERADAMTFTAELCVGSAGNIDRDTTETFFRVFGKIKTAMVIINEEDDSSTTEFKQEISPPIARFAITAIGTIAPPAIEL
ncbi:MAG: hypothetical protein WBK28_03390 [Minisyncoccia bacterium]